MKYYSRKKICSFNTDYNFICGGKDIGKSYQFKEMLVHQFLTKGKQFLFIVRFENELDGSLNKAVTYFEDKKLKNKYPDYQIELKNNTYYITNKITNEIRKFGQVGILNKLSKQTGSIVCEDIWTILFEEFQNIDNKYLKDEVDKFLILYQSIARGENTPIRKVKCYFLSNAFSIANPYFTYFDIDKKLRIGTKILNLKSKNVTVEMAEAEDIMNKIRTTDFYKLIKGTRFDDFSLNNKFYLDNPAIIKRKNANDKIFIKFLCDNKIYSLYRNKDYLLFSDISNKEKTEVITITENDFKPNHIKIDLFKKASSYQIIKKFFQISKIYFTSQKAYQTFLFILSF